MGDEFELNGERMVVADWNPDRGELTLENGDKYGTQVIEDAGEIYIDFNSKIQEGEGQPALTLAYSMSLLLCRLPQLAA